MAGGIMIPGCLVVGSVLLVMDIIIGAKAQQGLEKVLKNKAQSEEIKWVVVRLMCNSKE